MLPILHLNGFKIANPTVLARLPHRQLRSLLEGYGYRPWFVEGDDPYAVHQSMAESLDEIMDVVQGDRRGSLAPMIVMRTPKGWTGPVMVDGHPVEGHFRSHQVPLKVDAEHPGNVAVLEAWMRSYRPEELFDKSGRPHDELLRAQPVGDRRMSANPRANGGLLRTELDLPTVRSYALDVARPPADAHSAMSVAGAYLRDVINQNPHSFRLFGPDEVESNKLSAVFEETDRVWLLERRSDDEGLDPAGRVMEILSEHLCQGWLEGYLLTGRHGVFTCYEAFVHIVDSMFNQHAKWLEESVRVPWRSPISSLNYLLTSHVWRQDHNGFTHQDPGFLDVAMNKKPEVVRVYLPPDANSLLVVLQRCLASTNLVNVIVAGKQNEPQYLDVDQALEHLDRGASVWHWAGTEQDRGTEPDVVLACAGDVPTMETVAAAQLLADHTHLSIRVVNVVDLMVLDDPRRNPNSLEDRAYRGLFGDDVPVVFAFHGYPALIHRLAYKRANHQHLHVRGYNEEGSTTTPFDMLVRNELDHFHLAIEAIDRVEDSRHDLSSARQLLVSRLAAHHQHVRATGTDLVEVTDWPPSRD